MSMNAAEPMSPQDYSRGLLYRAVIGGAILLIGVVPMILAGQDGIGAWFAEPLIGDLSRAVGWLILMAAIESAVLMSFVLRSSPRVRAWREQHDAPADNA